MLSVARSQWAEALLTCRRATPGRTRARASGRDPAGGSGSQHVRKAKPTRWFRLGCRSFNWSLKHACRDDAFYLPTAPDAVDTLERAWLAEDNGPRITEEGDFKTDAQTYKVRHVFAGRWLDWRGAGKGADQLRICAAFGWRAAGPAGGVLNNTGSRCQGDGELTSGRPLAGSFLLGDLIMDQRPLTRPSKYRTNSSGLQPKPEPHARNSPKRQQCASPNLDDQAAAALYEATTRGHRVMIAVDVDSPDGLTRPITVGADQRITQHAAFGLFAPTAKRN